ncbi:LysR family transcriptional regulator [Streptomyces sp. MA15]|uniref:LysR family transcriptional regulator n=1 Tax=unclassified Streptomyces TaxID=2593676 RepID=UPI0025B0B9B2|nr:LysR family transcriptional regulator [Streptomyces sp. MA15]MDN3272244.1 LysR family transcriptional regulator [Streptomyces sp. MA15]
MLNVHRLLLLREVEARGSIVAAARALNYTRSAVSQQLTSLEAETGATLLDRSGNRVELTAAGHLLVRHADRIIGQLEAAEAELHARDGVITGTLRIGVPLHEGPSLVAPAATRLRSLHPRLRVTLHGVTPAGGREGVRLGQLDVALAARYSHVPVTGRPGLYEEELLTDEIRLAVAPGHPLARSTEPRPLAEFADESWVLDRTTDLGRLGLHVCADAGFVPDVVCDTGDMQAVLGLVSLGWGVALVPDLAPDRAGHPVVRVPVQGHRLRRHTTLVVREGALNSPPVAALLPALREAAGLLAPSPPH